MFGLGNHLMYASHFVDAIGFFGQALRKKGAVLYGKTKTDGYTFEESLALEGNEFLGLPIDHDTQEDLTDERVNNWVAALKTELSW